MPYSYDETVGAGATNILSVPFPYLEQTHVHVSVDSTEVDQADLTWLTSSTIQLPNAAATYTGQTLRVYRETPAQDPIVTFQPGNYDPDDLNNAVLQILYIGQEAYDITGDITAVVAVATAAASTATTKAGEATAAAAAAAVFDPALYQPVETLSEAVQDVVGSLLPANDSGLLTAAYDDAGNTLTLDVAVASQAEAEAGAASTKAMTPQRVAQALLALNAVKRLYEATGNAIGSGTLLDLTHGLGAKPKLVQLSIVCTVAENGYSVGDEVVVAPFAPDGGTSTGVSMRLTPTQIRIRYGSNAGVFVLNRADTGAVAVATNTSWTLTVRAFS